MNWNGGTLRVRLLNEDIAYGLPRTGYPVWMDNAAILADAQNVENARAFLNFIMDPENAAEMSNYAKFANGIAGSEVYMDAELNDAPELRPSEELLAAGFVSRACSSEAHKIYTEIWTELRQ